MSTPDPARHPVLVAAERYKARLIANERAATRQLVDAYARSLRRLDGQIAALTEILRTMESPMRADVLQLASFKSLRTQITDEMARLNALSADTIDRLMVDAMTQAGDDALALVQAQFPTWRAKAIIAANWQRLPTEAVEQLLGMTQPDSPLYQRLEEFATAGVDAIMDRMVEGIVLGKNPRDVARTVVGLPLTDALRNARTAQIWSYREATRANYKNNEDVVSGWMWYATFDDRTCASCLAMHGKEFSNNQTLNDHYNGRCVMVPIVPLAEKLGVPTPNSDAEIAKARAFFDDKPDTQKLAHLGGSKKLLEAYQSGALPWDGLSVERNSGVAGRVYGPMRGLPSAGEVTR